MLLLVIISVWINSLIPEDRRFEIACRCLRPSSDLLLIDLVCHVNLGRPLVFPEQEIHKKHQIIYNIHCCFLNLLRENIQTVYVTYRHRGLICWRKHPCVSSRLIDVVVYADDYEANTPRTFNYMFMCVILILILNQLLIFHDWHLVCLYVQLLSDEWSRCNLESTEKI